MTQLEVDMFDAPEIPAKLPSEPEETSEPNALADVLLGKDEEETPEKSQEEGKKTVENYSKAIQEHAEELYATLSYKAKTEDGFIEKLIESSDPLERKYAKKILERNAEHFGSSTIEEFQKAKVLKDVGDDPTARKLAELEIETKSLKNQNAENEWKSWKKSRNVDSGTEFDSLLDTLHSQYPTMPHVDIMALAKGRTAGGVNTKSESSFNAGGASPSETDDPFTDPLASKLLRDPQKTKKFAKEYLKGGIF